MTTLAETLQRIAKDRSIDRDVWFAAGQAADVSSIETPKATYAGEAAYLAEEQAVTLVGLTGMLGMVERANLGAFREGVKTTLYLRILKSMPGHCPKCGSFKRGKDNFGSAFCLVCEVSNG